MNLLIDIGNTRTKWFLTDEDGVLKDMGACNNADIETNQFIQADVDRALIAAVGSGAVISYIESQCAQHDIAIERIQAAVNSCGVTNHYHEPAQLGVDRWLSLIAAYQSDYGHSLVVTAGTAVTIDALMVQDEGATFAGGSIMPGLGLMQSLLHENTANLPDAKGHYQTFPKTTDDAMYSGALTAIFSAIQYQWQNLYDVVNTPPKLVLSGGDAKVIAEKIAPELANHMIIVDNLVLRGLMHLEQEKQSTIKSS